MKTATKQTFIILALIFTQSFFSQINDPNSFNPKFNLIGGNELNENNANFISQKALSKQTFIDDFRVNEWVGNSSKSNVKSAANSNGIIMVVWD